MGPQQSAILSGGFSPWQAPLAALFSGISAAAQPGGFANFGQGVQQGQQNFQQGQQQQQMMDLRRMQMEQAQEEQRRANQEETQRQATIERLRQLGSTTGSSTTPVNPVGGYGAATGGIQTASGTPVAAMFQDNPQLAAIYGGFLDDGNVEGALDFLAKNMPQAAGPAEAPTVKDFYEGGNVVQKQWDGQQWVEVGRGNRWQPEQAAAPRQRTIKTLYSPTGEARSVYDDDPSIPDLLKAGWIDDKPSGGGVQVDTNGDGNPDITVGGPGMKPPNATQATHNIKALLLSQGLDDIANVNFANVSPAKMAAAEAAGEKAGPIGEWGASVFMNDDEKRLAGAQGAIQEAVISAVTGASYTEQQKRNMRAKYVILPTDSATRRAEKTKAAAEFLAQEDRNSGNSRVQTEGEQDNSPIILERGPDGKLRPKQ
jgi:hypothetical protein